MFLLLFFSKFFLFFGGFAHDGYSVIYQHEVYKIASGVKNPKVAIPEEYRAALGKDSISITEAIGLPYKIKVKFCVDQSGNYTYEEWSENPKAPLQNNFPRFYKNGHFYNGRDTTSVAPVNYIVKKQRGEKMILEYKCSKFLLTNNDTGETYEMWGTKALPQSITALPLLRPFGYAILEITDLHGYWKRTAIEINKQSEI